MKRLKMIGMGLAVGLSALATPDALAQPARSANPKNADLKVHADELLDFYDKGCLHAYQAGSLPTYAESLAGAVPISEKFFPDFAGRLGAVGRAWLVRTENGTYVIAIGNGIGQPVSPIFDRVRRCAVLTTGPEGLALETAFHALAERYAAETGQHLQHQKPMHTDITSGETDIMVESKLALLYRVTVRPTPSETEYVLGTFSIAASDNAPDQSQH